MGEALKDWKACSDLVRTISSRYRIPFFTISPTYSICRIHGYLPGEQFECPKCKAERERELMSRLESLQAEKEKILSKNK
jgi:ribonucleoside-triphosphate reductase